jgi:hypothetical protein
LVRWETINDHKILFVIQVAWTGALSSVLLGLWRLWAHHIDTAIVRLYPAIYLSERFLPPGEVCTIRPPNGTVPLSHDEINRGVEYQRVQNKDFGGRGHRMFDGIAASVIIAFALSACCWLRLKE